MQPHDIHHQFIFLVLFTLIIIISCSSTSTSTVFFLVAETIEFKRDSYSDSSSADWTIFGRTQSTSTSTGSSSSSSWRKICFSTTFGSSDAAALCEMMGYNASNARFFSDYTASTTYGIGGLRCIGHNNYTDNLTVDFGQCSYTTTDASCRNLNSNSSGMKYRFMRLRCGALLNEGGSRGIFVGSGDSFSGTQQQPKKDMFVRRRYNGQVQLREIFSTTWKNIAVSSSAEFNYNAVDNLCSWTTTPGGTKSRKWKYMSFAQTPVLNSQNGFAIKNMTCKTSTSSTTPTLASCSYYDNDDTVTSTTNSSKAIAINCDLKPTHRGVEIGSGYSLALLGSSSYKLIQISAPLSTHNNNESALPSRQPICASIHNSMNFNTRCTLCRWAGYGSGAYGYTSAVTSTTLQNAPIFQSLSCPYGASSIDECTKVLADASTSCSQYYNLYCVYSDSDPSSSTSSKKKKDGFPFEIVLPIMAVAGVVVFFAYYKQKKVRRSSGGNSRNNRSINNRRNGYRSFQPGSRRRQNNNDALFAPTGQVMSNENNNIQEEHDIFTTPSQPPPIGYSPQNDNNHQEEEQEESMMMSTLDESGDNVAPPSGGYSFMPTGFDGSGNNDEANNNGTTTDPPPPENLELI